MMDITVVKVLGVAWITLVSAVGIWCPFLCTDRVGNGQSAPLNGSARSLSQQRTSSALSSGRVLLSLANCFSAGMLLAMALLHFFPSALAAAEGQMSVMAVCAWMLSGIVFPAILEHGSGGGGGGGHGHSHGTGHESDSEEKPVGKTKHSLSTATLLVILMCFHGMMEGVLLGFEQRVSSLISVAMPLSIHRFFDGVVIGVSKAKEMMRSTSSNEGSDAELIACPSAAVSYSAGEPTTVAISMAAATPSRPPRRRSLPRRPFSLCGRHVWQPSVLAWLALTPVTMVAVLLFSMCAQSPATGDAGVGVNNPNTVGVTQGGHNARLGASKEAWWMAVAQAVGSGSFVYIALSIFLHEELRGMRANILLLVGVVFTVLMFAVVGDEH